MQPQSSSTAPTLSPPKPSPAVVSRRHVEPPSRKGWWLAGLVVVIAIGAGLFLWRRQAVSKIDTVGPAVRTATVTTGILESTIRLTGSTNAENFVQLITPQLRGSRSDSHRSGGSIGSASAPPTLAQVPAGIGPSATSSGSSTSMSTAMQASTSRTGSAPKAATTSSSATTSPSAAMGSDGTGSTSGAIQGGGGGGGGGGDFGLVLQKVVKPGSRVKKGETVAEFDRQYMMNRLDDYRAGVIQTQASLLKLKANLTIIRHAREQSIAKAKAAMDKAKLDLKTAPVLSNINAERAKLAVEETTNRYQQQLADAKQAEISINSQIRNAEIELQQSNIELRRAEANADRMLVKAPIDGLTVMSTVPRGGDLSQIQEGDQLYPGIQFMSIVDPRSMVINATVNQADVEKLRLGAKAKVRFDAYPGLELAAHIYSVGGITKPGGQRATYVKEIPVRLKLDQMDSRVIPDLSVSADVIIATDAQPAAVVPRAGVFRDSDSESPYVYVRNGAAWIRRAVTLGLANHVFVAVQSGVKENEVIALDRPPGSENRAAAQ